MHPRGMTEHDVARVACVGCPTAVFRELELELRSSPLFLKDLPAPTNLQEKFEILANHDALILYVADLAGVSLSTSAVLRLMEAQLRYVLLITEIDLAVPFSYADAWEHVRLDELLASGSLAILTATQASEKPILMRELSHLIQAIGAVSGD